MFNQYPYLNINDLNLDFVLNAIREMKYEVTNFVSINAIKYADPIQWNITSQYEKNTIVIDPVTGTAYISVAPVPSGVALTRPEYWTVVFDLGSFVTRAAQNFTNRYESDTTTTATFPTTTGSWLVWGDVLYKALTNITAGDTYVVGGNIEHFTIEDLYNAYLNTIASILTMIGDLDNLTTTNKDSLVDAINEINQTGGGSIAMIGDLVDLNTTNKDTVVDAINEVLQDVTDVDTNVGDPNDLNTTNKNNTVDAINEVLQIANDAGVEHYADPVSVYVSDATGDDTNDGSNVAPFKTLDKALSLLNVGVNSLYVYIMDAATYTIKKQEIGGVTLHIVAQVNGVVINYDIGNVAGKFYNCHLNFRCLDASGYLTIDNPNFTGFGGWYAENSAVSFNRVNIPCGWVAYGGNIAFTDVRICAIWLWSCNGFIQNCVIANTQNNQSAIWIRNNCNISIANTIHHENTLPSNVTHGFIRVERSIVRFLINNTNLITGDTDMTYKYNYGISGSNSIIEVQNDIFHHLRDFSYDNVNGTLDGCDLTSTLFNQINGHENAYIRIGANSDLNDYVTPGQYRTTSRAISESLSNCPYTASSIRLDVVSLGSPAHLWQILTALESDGLYIRTYDSATQTFGNWDKIANNGSLDSTAVATNTISNGDDLNDYITNGFYRAANSAIAASLSHCPYTGSGFKLTCKFLGGGGHLMQIIEGVQLVGSYRRTITLSGGVFVSATHWFKFEGTDTGA